VALCEKICAKIYGVNYKFSSELRALSGLTLLLVPPQFCEQIQKKYGKIPAPDGSEMKLITEKEFKKSPDIP